MSLYLSLKHTYEPLWHQTYKRHPSMFNAVCCINFKWAMPDASALPLHVVIIRIAAKCTTASLWFSLYPMIQLIQFLEAIFIHFLP